ncbi:alpha/beta fold hydrolase [Mucilaginibacter sp. UC70_90]
MEKEYASKKDYHFITAKEKNDRKVFMLDYKEPNIKLSALKTIKCPSLIIAGDHDLIVTTHTVQIAENIPNAYLWILPNSGHGTLVEHAGDFNKKVDDFFEQPFHRR